VSLWSRKNAGDGTQSIRLPAGADAMSPSPEALASLDHTDLTTPAEARPAAAPLPFRRIFDENVVAVGRTLRYLGVAEADLTDAAQEVFLVVDRRYGEFEGRAALSTWIHEICIRVAMDRNRRRKRRREEVVPDPPEVGVEADQHASLERGEARVLVMRLLEQLDDRQRQIIVLHEIERLPMRQVAEIAGIPLQTAYTRRATALERMRDLIDRWRRRHDRA
jgi:RNA polymerase sigma-70 factor (ECF subfamily)